MAWCKATKFVRHQHTIHLTINKKERLVAASQSSFTIIRRRDQISPIQDSLQTPRPTKATTGYTYLSKNHQPRPCQITVVRPPFDADSKSLIRRGGSPTFARIFSTRAWKIVPVSLGIFRTSLSHSNTWKTNNFWWRNRPWWPNWKIIEPLVAVSRSTYMSKPCFQYEHGRPSCWVKGIR